MASRPAPSLFSLAPKQLSQMINPFYWLTSGTGQIGLINISGAASAKPEVEADIIENVATYGRQLGRMTDVLQAVLAQMHPEQWSPGAQEAVRQFREMTAKIAVVKAGYLAPTRENVDQLVAGIKCLKETDSDEYKRITDDLKEKLFADNVGKAKTASTKPRRSGGRK